MIGDYVLSDGVGSKKRSLSLSPDSEFKSKQAIMSPPPKKLKQARLPFKLLSSPSPNQCLKSPAVDNLTTKKRKLSGSEKSPALILPIKGKNPDGKSTSKKTLENPAKKKVADSPGTPKRSCLQKVALEPEVSSSCEDQDGGKGSSSFTPRRLTTTKPKLLDSFLQTTQQPQVSTSDDVIEIEDDEVNEVLSTSDEIVVPQCEDGEDMSALSSLADVTAVGSVQQGSISNETRTSTEEDPSQDVIDLTLHMSEEDSKSASKLGYDADMEDEDDEELKAVSPRTVSESSEAESSMSVLSSPAGSLSTPKGIARAVLKVPLSAKALKKEEERRKLREEKINFRMEKKRKLDEEEAERKRMKMELKVSKEQEREEARKQKELEKEEKRKEKQQKKDQEEMEKEQKKVAKEEEKKKKQEIIDAKMEEKRKKVEEKQQQEDEKLQQEEEKRKKEAKQKTFFKSFFKEAAPVKKTMEKTSGWYAPFQLKEKMVLAPLCRNPSFLEAKEKFDTTFTDQNCTSLYFDELRSKKHTAGKMGRTPSAEEEKVLTSRTSTPSVEKMAEEKDSQDLEIVSVSQKSKKQTTRMKCKFLQFHENYRPAYYGTWRQRSKTINPRKYLRKDEDLLDYEIDSDDEWEEPGESLSHSEGEEDGEDEQDAGDSDDGFFVPHGYLSESEGCEDEEEAEHWKERRAAKAKSWEVELKRQQGVLKAIIVGCLWETNSSKISAGNLKAMDAYKMVALTTIPIDTRRRKQMTLSSEEMACNDPSKMRIHSKMGVSLGASLKRPVPAEAMPDLIRLVHGNIAGIRTLQREFREYWRLEQLKRNPGKSSSSPADAPKGTKDITEGVVPVSPLSLASGVGNEDKPPTENTGQTAGAVAECPSPPAMPSSLGGEGTRLMTIAGVSSTTDNATTANQTDCSISKRQLLITINAIAVRERRPTFPRTCWYVHQNLLDKYNLQNLPIPGQWQNITKPQKVVRTESPLPGQVVPAFSRENNARIHPADRLPMTTQHNQGLPVHPSFNPGMYLSPKPQPSGMPSEPQWRLQGNTVRENLASVRSAQFNPLTGVNLQQQPMVQSGGGLYLPVQMPLSNGMSASEIIQKLSASIPLQPFQQPAPLTHAINPILSNEQVHYLNMLPRQTFVSHQTSTAPVVGLPSLPTQINKLPAPGHVLKASPSSPTDIKAMLASQTVHADIPNVIPLSKKAAVSAPSQSSASSITTACGNPDECTAAQLPAKKTATLKNFFNVSVKPLPKPSTTCSTIQMMDTSDNSNEMSLGEGDAKPITESKGSAQNIQADCSEISRVGTSSLVNDKEGFKKGECQEEKMEVDVSQE